MIPQTIFLQGMCYSGKTTIGTMLAQRFNKKFLDSRYIFYNYWNTYDLDYLNDNGQQKFQIAEKESLKQDFFLQDVGVVALSGSTLYLTDVMQGIYSNPQNLIIWLDVSYDTVMHRKKNENTERPIVFPEGINSFQELYTSRRLIYETFAHISVQIDENDSKEDVVEKIFKSITNILSVKE